VRFSVLPVAGDGFNHCRLVHRQPLLTLFRKLRIQYANPGYGSKIGIGVCSQATDRVVCYRCCNQLVFTGKRLHTWSIIHYRQEFHPPVFPFVISKQPGRVINATAIRFARSVIMQPSYVLINPSNKRSSAIFNIRAKRRLLHRLYWLVFLSSWVASIMLAACTPQPPAIPRPAMTPSIPTGEVDVPFETVAQNEWGTADIYKIGPDPQVLWISSSAEVAQIQDFVDLETLAAVQKVEFQHHSVLALFRGLMGSSNYQTVIERITQKDGQLIVYAQFWEPGANQTSATVLTTPYHIVKVAKAEITTERPALVLRSYALTPTPLPTSATPPPTLAPPPTSTRKECQSVDSC
jgi:PrcB C-terminal